MRIFFHRKMVKMSKNGQIGQIHKKRQLNIAICIHSTAEKSKLEKRTIVKALIKKKNVITNYVQIHFKDMNKNSRSLQNSSFVSNLRASKFYFL